MAIDDGAAGRVDEHRPSLHPADLLRADEATAFARQLDVQADHVGARQQFFERNKRHAQAGRPLRRGVKGPRQHFHADGLAQPGHLRGDAAGADQAERLAAQVDVVPRRPAARLQLVGLKPGPLGHRQHQTQGMLGDNRRRLAGQVADHDAQFLGRLQVDGVRADAADGDHFQARQSAEHFARPLDRPAAIDQADGVAGTANLVLDRGRPIGVEDDLAVAFQPFEVRRALQLRRVVAGNHDHYVRVHHLPSWGFPLVSSIHLDLAKTGQPARVATSLMSPPGRRETRCTRRGTGARSGSASTPCSGSPSCGSSRREARAPARRRGRAAVLRDGAHVFDVRVLAPLPDVAGHVEEAELVRGLPGDVLGVVAALAVVPRDEVDVVAAAEPVPVAPVRAAARGVLPLGLRGQAKHAVRQGRLGQELPAGFALREACEEAVGPDELVPRHVLQGQERAGAATRVRLAHDVCPEGLRHRGGGDEEVLHLDLADALAPVRAEAVGRPAGAFDAGECDRPRDAAVVPGVADLGHGFALRVFDRRRSCWKRR